MVAVRLSLVLAERRCTREVYGRRVTQVLCGYPYYTYGIPLVPVLHR